MFMSTLCRRSPLILATLLLTVLAGCTTEAVRKSGDDAAINTASVAAEAPPADDMSLSSNSDVDEPPLQSSSGEERDRTPAQPKPTEMAVSDRETGNLPSTTATDTPASVVEPPRRNRATAAIAESSAATPSKGQTKTPSLAKERPAVKPLPATSTASPSKSTAKAEASQISSKQNIQVTETRPTKAPAITPAAAPEERLPTRLPTPVREKIEEGAEAMASNEANAIETIRPPTEKIESAMVAPTPAPAPPDSAAELPPALLQGQIRLISSGGQEIPPTSVILSVHPQSASTVPAPSKTHRVDMKHKVYLPGALFVRKGDTVRFHNRDAFKHNVFSRSSGNAFDLGTYGPGASPGQRFENSGIVRVYCNIHPSMATFVRVSDTPWGQVIGVDGRYRISDLPAGSYRVTAWNIRGEMSENIELQAGEQRNLDLVIDGSQYVDTGHLNKFGKPYEEQLDLGGGFEYF